MRRVRPREVCVLRRPSPLVPAETKWVVTARYDVTTSATESLACVRVRGHTGQGGLVLHFSVKEFNRLFKPLE